MPAHKRMRVSLGELAGRAADEETRRLVSEFGISANLRVTCRLRSQWKGPKFDIPLFFDRQPARRYLDVSPEGESQCSADKATFEWCVSTSHGQWRFEVPVTCNNAIQRGVPRPKVWPQMVRCAIVEATAHHSSSHASLGPWVADVCCTFLGAPIRVQPHEGAETGPGSVVSLKSPCRAGRRWYLTVAHVLGDLWLCADGSLDAGEALALDRLFAEDLLQLKDIVSDACEEPTLRPHKRVRVHVKAPQVRAAVSAHAWRFSSLVARAKWRAEEIRSGLQGRALDLSQAAAGYAKDPMLWHAGGWESQIEVAAAWLWRCRGELQYERLTSRLDHWSQRRSIPLPPSLQPATESDQQIWEELLKAAEQAVADGYAPCAYLGLRTEDGRYEPDPSKWPTATARGAPKQQEPVFYEWLYVKHEQAREPYRVSVRVENILRHKAPVPGHPLNRAAHGSLCFTMRFLDEFAERRWPGTRYRGVTFDNPERPEIYEQLPNDGLDIQHHPLYWVLPCGRCVCMSLRELYVAKSDQLLPHNSKEAYREIASELHFDVLGVAPEEQLVTFKEDLGTLADQKWLPMSWSLPADEASPCWLHRVEDKRQPKLSLQLDSPLLVATALVFIDRRHSSHSSSLMCSSANSKS